MIGKNSPAIFGDCLLSSLDFHKISILSVHMGAAGPFDKKIQTVDLFLLCFKSLPPFPISKVLLMRAVKLKLNVRINQFWV